MPGALSALWVLTAVFGLLPAFWAWQVAFYYWRKSAPPGRKRARYQPKAVVILPLRGSDPSLEPCVRGLLKQDYADYFIHIVIDNPADPAWQTVQWVLAQECADAAKVRVSFLCRPYKTCGLKVSAQLQAIAELDPSVEVVCFLDADSIPAADWISELVAPLAQSKVGATTGIRWFAPPAPTLGNLVRYIYNAGSVTQMHIFNIPWGGSFALRREALVRSGLPEHWSRCFCEDTATYGALRSLGLKVRAVPTATQVNRESIDLEGAKRFLVRQLLCVRLHHVSWPLLLALNVANAAALTFASAMALAGAILAHGEWVTGFGGIVAGFALGQLGALLVGEWLVRRNMRGRALQLPRFQLHWNIIRAGVQTQVLAFQGLIWHSLCH